ncbi:cytochrome c [Sediminibacter sp. Hel_I_10]|uniref:c-type cytochrome n=1 Tax=Sediminibacter sp. Hel_I_10 TaxID=1392490 RepID=UPI00068B1A09|nr:cytochrome c [Sediminibacter sp. Hel_I_10]
MKSLIQITLVLFLALCLVACNQKGSPNYEYMPNMYESVGYEAYQEAEPFDMDMEAKLPAEGSVARGGHLPFEFENNNDGYLNAKANLTNPLDSMALSSMEGGQNYDIYCAICHGKNGNGQGTLVKNEKILGVPSYDDVGRAINEGSIYHVIYYGKNAMGSYKNQLNEKERWQVVNYVMDLKKELMGKSAPKEEAPAETAMTETN